jgi:hypothetical protein
MTQSTGRFGSPVNSRTNNLATTLTIVGRLPFSALALALAVLYAAELRAQQPPPPPNDNLANAVEVSGLEFQLTANLGAATREAFEPYAQYNFGRTA